MFEEAGFEPKTKLKLSQLVTAYHLAAAGIGATFVRKDMNRDSSFAASFSQLKELSRFL